MKHSAFIVTLLLLLLTACTTTKYITEEVPVEVIKEVPVEVVKTEYVSSNFIDSTFVRDSIDRFVKGDTVIIYKEKYITKYKTKTDTITKVDSIPVIVREEVPVTVTKTEQVVTEVNKLYWYQKFLLYLGLAALIYTVVRIIILIYLRK